MKSSPQFMEINLKTIVVTAALAGAAFTSSASPDTLLYDNGPINGTVAARTISDGLIVTDSFNLAGDATVDSVTIGVWLFPGDTLNSVDWSITTAPLGGTVLAAGTSATSSAFLFTNFGYGIYAASFGITPTALAAGTYWLQLENAVTAESYSAYAYWDVNNGPSAAYQSAVGSVDSESFQVYGTVPEPTTLALAGLGGLALLAVRRKK